jgi:hypothetical protein
LFQGVPGARAYRRRLADAASAQAGAALLIEALALVSDGVLADNRAAA